MSINNQGKLENDLQELREIKQIFLEIIENIYSCVFEKESIQIKEN